MTKTACVAVVRNESRHIAEWLAWQFLTGFDAVILLDNNSTDNTATVARAAVPGHDIRVIPWPDATPGYQTSAYEYAAHHLAAEFGWLAFFDADEFLVLPEPTTLQAALGRCAHAAAIAIPWAIFGSSGHREVPTGLITHNFTHRAGTDFFPNRHVKSIIRPHLMRAARNPHHFEMDGATTDLQGRLLAFAAPGVLAEAPDFSAGKLHHYFVKSWSHWQEKMSRGYRDLTRPEAEFFTYDRNDIFDDSAARRTPAILAFLAARPQPPETCAIVLVVKNEVTDIPAWLAWYHAIGATACIIYDDNSTDGTYEYLQSAATRQPIHLHRTQGETSGPYEPRQEASYRHALATYAQQFDWLAFFDADEFLQLNQDETLTAFLARFPHAAAVAVNWCTYGSSFHLLKPSAPPFDAYTWHGSEQEPINRHVKSIVRPTKIGPAWRNVHCFDTAPESCLLANGAPATWSATPGIIDRDPDWSVAKLMHFQCRSMEHFIERLKRRPELATIPGIWPAHDIHQIQSFVPPKIAAAARAQIAKLHAPPPAPQPIMPDLIFDIGMSEGNDTAFYRAKNFRVVGVEADAKIFIALHERFEPDIAAGNIKIHNCAAAAHAGDIVEFHRHNQHQGLSSLSHSRAEFTQGAYTTNPVLTIDWPTLARRHGIPHYLKLDIEGAEAAFLQSIKNAETPMPSYISVECRLLDPAVTLHDLGYAQFQLVDQNPEGGFQLPTEQQEGATITWHEWHHTSGPFGRDLPDAWVDFEEFQRQWHAASNLWHRTWFDCHARLAPPG